MQRSAAINVYYAPFSAQTGILNIPSANQYVGGAFKITATGASSVTKIIVTRTGTVASSDLSAVRMHYDIDSSSPHDCSSESYSQNDPAFGFATTFDLSNKATFTGSAALSSTQTVCFYLVLDVGSGASNGETLEVEIANPSVDILASGDVAICPKDEQNKETCPDKGIPGTTVLSLPPPSVVSVTEIGSQTSVMNIPSTDQYAGGAFRMIPDIGLASITRVTISEKGTVTANSNLSSVRLYYDVDATQPYDCMSESYSPSDSLFGSKTAFDTASKSVFNGNVDISTTQAVCFYVVLNVESNTVSGNTIDIEIANPSQDVIVAVGAAVSPNTAVKLSGVTTLTPPPVTVVTVSAFGSQVSSINIPSSNEYIGGAFRMVTDSGSTSITRIAVSQRGAILYQDISAIRLYYDIDSTAPYDCVSESYGGSESQFGATGVLNSSSKSTFDGSLGISSNQAACFYVVIDIKSTAVSGGTVDIEISNPSTEIIASGGASISPQSALPISGTTILTKPAYPTVTVSAIGSQVSLLNIPSFKQYIGGTFRMTLDIGSATATVTGVTITEKGSASAVGTALSNARFYYDTDSTQPYDCFSESYSESDFLYGVPTSFGTGEKVQFNGNLVISATKAACFYVILDIGSEAKHNTTLELEITNPSTDVSLSSAGEISISPKSAVPINGTTMLSEPTLPTVTVSSFGSQTPLMTVPSINQYIGGSFRMVPDSGSAFISKIILTEKGTILEVNIPSARLYYDFDTSGPYDCASEKFSGSDPLFDQPSSLTSGKVTFTGTGLLEVTPSRIACFYVVIDIGSAAAVGESVEIEISSPAKDIVASGGATVSPATAITIVGTTILTKNVVLQDHSIVDGDLIRRSGEIDIYIAKFTGTKKFKRLILNPQVFNSYGHLKWANVKEVSDVSVFITSDLVRAVSDPLVYRLAPVGDTGTRHHVDMTSQQFAAAGLDWDSIYEINAFERGIYKAGSQVEPPPVVFDEIKVLAVTPSSAVISWKTSRPSDTAIDYGLDSNYKFFYKKAGSDISPLTEHQVDIGFLMPSTTYHFSVTSKEPGSRYIYKSGDYAFTTSP